DNPKVHPINVAEIVLAEPSHRPLRPSRSGERHKFAAHILPVVGVVTTGSANRRQRLALDSGAADDPAQPSADQEDQGDQRPHTEVPVASPGASVGRLHLTSIEAMRPAVQWWNEEATALASFLVRPLGEGRGGLRKGESYSVA